MLIALPILVLTVVLVVLVVMYVLAVKATYGRLDGGFAEKLTALTRQKKTEIVRNEPEQIETLPVDDFEEDESSESDEANDSEDYVPAFVEGSKESDVDDSDEELEEPNDGPDEPLPWDE